MEGIFVLLLIAAAVASIIIFARYGRREGSPSLRPPLDAGPGVHVAKVHRVIDGDTMIVALDLQRLTLRLDAIDCPEDGQHWGDTARFGLIKMIGGRRIRFENHGQEKFGRTLATVYVFDHEESQWVNVNARMVMLGHAWVSRHLYQHLPRHRQRELDRLERWARGKRVGLWKTAAPEPPWRWRKRAPKNAHLP